jgi:hypothetical protein
MSPPQFKSESVKAKWLEFREHRKNMRKTMTKYAEKCLIKKLYRLAKSEQEAIDIIQQSIDNTWYGLFELKGKKVEKTFTKPAYKVVHEKDCQQNVEATPMSPRTQDLVQAAINALRGEYCPRCGNKKEEPTRFCKHKFHE